MNTGVSPHERKENNATKYEVGRRENQRGSYFN